MGFETWGPSSVAIAVSLAAAIGAWRKGGAEGRALDAQGANAIVTSGVQVLTLRDTEIANIKADLQGLLTRERLRDRMALVHERWDLDVVDRLDDHGITVPPPPPLWLDDTEPRKA